MPQVKRGRPKKQAERQVMNRLSVDQSEQADFSQIGIENDTPVTEETVVRERKPRGRVPNDGKELERIEGMLRSSAMLLCAIASKVNANDASVIYTHTLAEPPTVPEYTPNLISATMQLCKEDKKVRAYLLGLSAQGAYLNIAMASGAIIMGIMANHKLLPPMFAPQESPNDHGASVD